MKTDIELAVNDILQAFFKKKGDKDLYFDSHLIIRLLLKKYSDVYLKTFSLMPQKNTAQYHSEIAKIIQANPIVIDTRKTSLSVNIRGNISKCRLWKI